MKEKLKIAVLVDFDGTLFDTWSNPYAQGEKKFDWKEVEKNIPNCPLYEGWKGVFAWLKSKEKQELKEEGCITLDTPLELIQLIKNQLNI